MRPWLLDVASPGSWARMAFYLAATISTLVLSLNWLGIGAEGAALTLIAAAVLVSLMIVGVMHWPRRGRGFLVWWLIAPLAALLDKLRLERKPGELVLSDAMSAACVRYYAPGLDGPLEIVALTAGTLPRPGTDFCRDAGERARTARGRVWWLTTDETLNGPGRAALETRLRGLGYRVRSVAKGAGSGTLGGAAELLVAER